MSGGPSTLADMLVATAARRPEATAVRLGERDLSYADLERSTGSAARLLGELGVGHGDRVAVWLDRSFDEVIALFAASRAGAAFVAVNPVLKKEQVHHVLENSGARVLVTSRKLADDLAETPGSLEQVLLVEDDLWRSSLEADDAAPSVDLRPDDLASLIYTSGSTGRPKGIALTHGNVVAGARIVASPEYLDIRETDRLLSYLPLSFDYGLNQLTTCVLRGATLVVPPSHFPADVVRTLLEERGTGFAGVPTIWALLLGRMSTFPEHDYPDLRYVTNSGGAIPTAHLEGLRRILPATNIVLMYGLTEAFRSTFLPPAELDARLGSMGRAIPECEVLVVRENGEECGVDEVGELVHRGPTVAAGYWNDREATARVFRPDPHGGEETVVYSGDLVRRDADGFLWFVSRADQMIKTGGYRVSPEEVEEILHRHPGIREAVVVGLPDETLGQRLHVTAVAESNDPPATSQVVRFCAERLPHHMVPREFRWLSDLPRTPSRKVDRARLRRELLEPTSRTTSTPESVG